MRAVSLLFALLMVLAVGCSQRSLKGVDAAGDAPGPSDAADASDAGGISDAGDASDAADASDAGGSDGRPEADAVVRGQGLIFNETPVNTSLAVERCDANGACPSGKVCFRVTADIALCDEPQPIAATACGNGRSLHPDECACNGLTCAANQVCINVVEEGSTGLSGTYNACVATACQLPSDCGGEIGCTPSGFIHPVGYPDSSYPAVGRCLQPLCQTDAACTDGNDGRCSLILRSPVQQGQLRIMAVRCVYRGAFDPTAPDPSLCAGTRAQRALLADPPLPGQSFYFCPGLAR